MEVFEIINRILKIIINVIEQFGISKISVFEYFARFIPSFYDLSDERIVEYTWILRNLDSENGMILDVGCGNSKFPLLLASYGYKVDAVDLTDYPFEHSNLTFVKGDILNHQTLPVDKKYDQILLISTLEHIGFSGNYNPDEDFNVLNILKSHLCENGSVLITVPFGYNSHIVETNEDFYRIYDEKRITDICRDFTITRADYFSVQSGTWLPILKDKIVFPIENIDSISNIACIKLTIPKILDSDQYN
jgi:SAM-dependent methyltransferase